MEERIDSAERQLRAAAEIDEEFSGDKLSREFRQLERGSASMSADMQLLELKQKMGMLPAPSSEKRALNSGEKPGATDAEFEELTEAEAKPGEEGKQR